VHLPNPAPTVVVPRRPPIAAQRPHKVTLVAIEPRTMNHRQKCRKSVRVLLDIDPPLMPGETITIEFIPSFRELPYGFWSLWAFDEHGEPRFDACDDTPDYSGITVNAAAGRPAIHGIECIYPSGDKPVEIETIVLNGKTVYGKEPGK
jgi:hypothetical protein